MRLPCSWNDFFFALILTRTEAMTAPVAVVNFMNYERSEWSKIAAGGTMVMLPVLFLSILVRKFLVHGLTAGASRAEATANEALDARACRAFSMQDRTRLTKVPSGTGRISVAAGEVRPQGWPQIAGFPTVARSGNRRTTRQVHAILEAPLETRCQGHSNTGFKTLRQPLDELRLHILRER